MSTTTTKANGAGGRPASTPASTRATFAKRAGRGYTPVRNSLVQVREGDKWIGSSLGRLVEARQPRALLTYLLLLMAWPWLERLERPLEAAVWARALSPEAPGHLWPASAMSRIWNTLEDHGLVERSREGHLVRVVPRREDGGKAYARPRPDQGKHHSEKFFVVPDAFWLDDWHKKLTLPGIAVLLILLAETQGRDAVHLTLDDANAWYGISAKTMQNGLNDLRKHSLLGENRSYVVNDLSAVGVTPHFTYWPQRDFSRATRQTLQRVATRETRKRVAKSASSAKKKKEAKDA